MMDEDIQFTANCYCCGASCITTVKITKIPHFQEVVLFATNCNACGFKDAESKSGQGIGEKGVKIVLPIQSNDDLNREVVRSDDCYLVIPEVELDIGRSGSGRYTTVEGLLMTIIGRLERAASYMRGDAADLENEQKIIAIINRLKEPIGLTIELDDPAGNSWISGATNVTRYERNQEQNEELGLSLMNNH